MTYKLDYLDAILNTSVEQAAKRYKEFIVKLKALIYIKESKLTENSGYHSNRNMNKVLTDDYNYKCLKTNYPTSKHLSCGRKSQNPNKQSHKKFRVLPAITAFVDATAGIILFTTPMSQKIIMSYTNKPFDLI